MTRALPQHVWFEVDAYLDDDTSLALDVENVVATMDMDANAYCSAEVTLRSVTDEVWTRLEPRYTDIDDGLYLALSQFGGDSPLALSFLPVSQTVSHARLFIRTVRRDWSSGQVTVFAESGESMMADKLRVATTTLNTAQTTVTNLVEYALEETFGFPIVAVVDPIVSSTLIPAGDRRLLLQGESYIDLILPELQAIDCRIYNYWGDTWHAVSRNTPPMWLGAPTDMKLASYTHAEGAPADANPSVFSVEETVTRDGDFADGVVVHGDFTNSGGTRVEWWQASFLLPSYSKGTVVESDRAQPAANIANQIITRSVIRGREVTVRAAVDFDVQPGQALTVYMRDGTLTANIRSVSWDLAANEMTIRAETGSTL